MQNLAAQSGRSRDAEEADQLARIPLGRANTADEIGRLITIVASPISGAMTGGSLTVDGGATRGLP
jgi:NAD(P)-dependent dehydrogenase (short-subunit alcohol dehydrogenase family)